MTPPDFAGILSLSSSDCGIPFFPKDSAVLLIYLLKKRFLQLQASMIPIQPWSSNSNSPQDAYWNNRMVEVVAFTHSCLWRTRTVRVLRETSPRCVSLRISKRAILLISTYISKRKKEIFHKVRLPYKLKRDFLFQAGRIFGLRRRKKRYYFSGNKERSEGRGRRQPPHIHH